MMLPCIFHNEWAIPEGVKIFLSSRVESFLILGFMNGACVIASLRTGVF